MNDELQGDSREYKDAVRMYNHDLKEYYRQHNYQIMPEEEEENGEIKVIPLREGRNGNPSGYLSTLGLKGNEAATVAAQPLRLQKGVDTLSDNKALSRISLSGNKASSSSYPSVRLAQNGYHYGTEGMTSEEISNYAKQNENIPIYDLLLGSRGQRRSSVCSDLVNSSKVYDPNIHGGQLFYGDEIYTAAKDDEYIKEQEEKSLKKCLEAGKDEEYCKRQAKSIIRCLLDARGEAKEKGGDYYDVIEDYEPSFLSEIWSIISR